MRSLGARLGQLERRSGARQPPCCIYVRTAWAEGHPRHGETPAAPRCRHGRPWLVLPSAPPTPDEPAYLTRSADDPPTAP